jgi:hypothetical protein
MHGNKIVSRHSTEQEARAALKRDFFKETLNPGVD